MLYFEMANLKEFSIIRKGGDPSKVHHAPNVPSNRAGAGKPILKLGTPIRRVIAPSHKPRSTYMLLASSVPC